MGLTRYRAKRNFAQTPEPRGSRVKRGKALTFVVQEHAASRLHYDFRLQHRGVLLSWAVPKGPSFDPADKRLAVRVEDHPLDYGGFEGVIPSGQYGAGRVLLWDRGHWRPKGDVDDGLREGKLEFELEGRKLAGAWTLVRLGGKRASASKEWLLIKRRDQFARTGSARAVTLRRTESVKSGRSLAEIGDVATRTKTRARSARPATAKVGQRGTRAKVRKIGPAKRRAHRTTTAAELSTVEGARRTALPSFVEPQLATLVSNAPDDVGWFFETKFDGYRMLARLQNGRVRWISRNGHDWSARFAALTPAILKLSAKAALLDGEVVVLRDDGRTSFQDLQRALGGDGDMHLTYVAFDLLHLDGFDLRGATLRDRKRLLSELLVGAGRSDRLVYSPHVEGSGSKILASACRKHFEGIIAKRADAPSRSTRTREWLKLKCSLRQEFVVVGFTQPQRSRVGFGALALATRDKGRLRYAGRVGTGFDRALLKRLRKQLDALRVDAPPLEGPVPTAARRGVTWVRPKIVAEVGFTEWTTDGAVRHPTFLGLREDKAVRDVVRERPAERSRRVTSAARSSRVTRATTARTSKAVSESVSGIVITHPDRVLFPEIGFTKLELARFYADIAPHLLPHIVQRPLSIVRCPDGVARTCFFQKHAGAHFPRAVGSVDVGEAGGHGDYLTIDSLEGMIALVQMGALELHPWGSRNDRPDAPDRLTFDLDPGPRVPWTNMIEAARRLRARLAELELDAFLKTTGGKGLHVVVPLERRIGWDELKSFARGIATEMERNEPKLYVATASKALRGGRIFIDYLRNARGATAVAAYSVRARPNAGVATPLAWDELDGAIRADTFDVTNLRERLSKLRRDPWAQFERTRQSLSARARRSVGE